MGKSAARGTDGPRIFLGLAEIADFYGPLQAGFEQLGYDAVFINLAPHPFYSTRWRGSVPASVKLAIAVAWRHARSSRKSRPLGAFWTLAALISRLYVLIWALATRDIFVFGFGSTFFGYRELPLLKLFRKRIIYNFHGSDSRPPYLDGAQLGNSDRSGVATLVELTREAKRRVSTIDRLADVVIDNPLSSHLHERPVVSGLAIGIPRQAPRAPVCPFAGKVVRVLHSPSDPRAKGSPAIRAAVERLRGRGIPIELVELSGVAHERVLEAIQNADLVVDQLYSDTAMAGFAAEAAAAGRPAVVGGYGYDEIESGLCGQPRPPVLFCQPDLVEASLERLVLDDTLRRELGTLARSFIETEWSRSAVAQRFIEAIEERRPEWVFDPRQITYVHGAGLSKAQAQANVSAVIEHAGIGALEVGDKPALEALLVQFAQADPVGAAAEQAADYNDAAAKPPDTGDH